MVGQEGSKGRASSESDMKKIKGGRYFAHLRILNK